MSTHGYICEHRECNVIVSFLCPLCLSPSVFSPSTFFIWLLTALSVFFSPPPSSLSHTVHYLCPVPSLFFFSSVLHPSSSSSTLFLSVWVFPSSPRPPPHLSPPAGCGHRKLVDCPQLLDVDDMVKMREPDWKCVYTYLQEFYRGLVTKGLVKTKNSS